MDKQGEPKFIYDPLLCDIQNLISEETKNEELPRNEKKRRELINYSVPFCAHPVPYIEPIFDFDFKQDKARSPTKSIACGCGYGHYLNGREYDFLTRILGISVGFNPNDYPESVVRKMFEDRGIRIPYEKIIEIGSKVRERVKKKDYFSLTENIIETNNEPTKRKTKKFVPLNQQKKKKISKPTPQSESKPTPKSESKSTPHSESKPKVVSNNNIRKSGNTAQGMNEYMERIKEQHAAHQEQLRKQQEKDKKKALQILKFKEKLLRGSVVIRQEQLTLFGISEIQNSQSIVFRVQLLQCSNSLTLEMSLFHRVEDIRTIIDSLVDTAIEYSLITTGSGQPSLLHDHEVIGEADIQVAGTIIQLPNKSAKFP